MHHRVCVVLEIRHYLLDVVLLKCNRNERGSYFLLFLDCEGVYRLLCDDSMPSPRWKRLFEIGGVGIPVHFLVDTRLVGISDRFLV